MLGKELFTQVFRANDDTRAVWNAVSRALADTRVEIVAEAEGLIGVPWELLRDPVTDEALALRAEAFVRAQPETASPVLPDALAGALRILLVICRPDRQLDVPFRSVARHLLRLSTQAQETSSSMCCGRRRSNN